MIREYSYSMHADFFIDKARRGTGYDMRSFHLHKQYEIYYQQEGSRKYFINDLVYLVNAGNLVLLGKNEVHKTGSIDNTPHTRIVVNFNSEYIQSVIDGLGGLDLLSFFDEGIKVLPISMKVQGRVQDLLTRMLDAHAQKDPYSQALCRILLAELLLCLRGCVAEQKAKQENAPIISNKTIDTISSYIAQNYRSSLTLPEIAARFYISPYYLSRLFKKTTNLSLVEYINSVRIREARKLLETTKLKVAEIAHQTGFATAAHFSRIFKQGTGLSPQQYRRFYHIG